MAEKIISLPNNWKPRQYQKPLWDYLSKGGKRAVLRWHRRSGKDDVLLHHTACSAHERVGNYWYLLPEYNQARKSMWDAVNSHTGKRRIDEAFPHELRKSTKEQEMMIQFHCGSTFQLVGSDNFNSLVGSPPVGLVFSEYAISNPSAWSYLRPILLENGGWAAFNSTPRGKNHFKSLCELAQREKGWFYSSLTAAESGVFSEEQLEAELRQMQSEHGDDYGRSLWEQEYFVSFDAAILGSIWGDAIVKLQNQGRIGDYPHDPRYMVCTAWDLGYSDATAIWFFQMIGDQIRIIDHHESNHKDIPFYGELLRSKARENDWKYHKHYVPHDARPRTLAAGGKSMLQQFQEEQVGQWQIAPKLDTQEGIQAARATLPNCVFNEATTGNGLEALKAYHHVWDDEKKTFTLAPEHDWSSHSCFTAEITLLTRRGTRRIIDLLPDDEVLTSCGFKRFQGPFKTRVNAQLVAVKFKDGTLARCTPEHLFLTDKGWKSAQSLQTGTLIQSSLTRSHSILMAGYIACGLAKNIWQGVAQGFTEMFGLKRLGRFLTDVTSITKTTIQKIIPLPTLSVCQPQNTCQMPGMKIKEEKRSIFQIWQGNAPPTGTSQKKGVFGTQDTLSERKVGQSGNEKKSHAPNAQNFSMLWSEIVGIAKSIVRPTAKPLLVESVSALNETEDVWDITVPNVGNFSLCNGAIVHNSDAFRYLSLCWRKDKPKSEITSAYDQLVKGSIANISFGELKKQFLRNQAAKRQNL